MLVIVHHLGGMPSGFIGVDIFFVISGYVITHALLESRDLGLLAGLRHFYYRRIVRILPPHRRKGHGTAYLAAELTVTRTLAPARIETVVHASNTSGLEFALKHGFVEHDRYVLDGQTVSFVDLHLEERS